MIALVPCPDYERQRVEAAVRQAVELAGGLDVAPGMRVFLKANLLLAHHPDRAATTHPEVLRALAALVRERGGIPVVGDSPGGPFSEVLLRKVYDATGLTALAEQGAFALNFDTAAVEVPFPAGRVLHKLTLVRAMVEADRLIAVGKLKTHGLTGMTGAAKNLFGAVPGLLKAEYHYRYPDLARFTNLLVDVAACANPCLSLVDAVDAMEGEGPSGGVPRRMGVLLAGANPHELDDAGARLMGQSPERYPLLRRARERDLYAPGYEVRGTRLEEHALPDFRALPPREGRLHLLVPARVKRVLRRVVEPKPVFLRERCVGCGDCARSCPPKVIRIVQGKAQADLTHCIRCYCCQELCPMQAVTIRRRRKRP